MAPAYYTPFRVEPSQITGTLTDFPTLVDMTNTRFKSISNGGHVTRTDGFDLVPYTDSTFTTKLPFEREFYDPVTGHFVDWVKIPAISNGLIIIYGYNDSAITTDQSNKASVWAGNYLMVNHLANGTTLSVADSTSHYTPVATGSPIPTGGKIDGCAYFNGVNNSQWIEWNNGQILFNQPTFSISVWIYVVSHSFESFIYSENRNTGVILLLRTTTAGKIEFGIYDGTTFFFATGLTSIPTGTFHYITVTRAATQSILLYLDGTLDGSVTDGGFVSSPITSAKSARIDNSGVEGHMDGLIDELRLSNIVRSSAWILAEYKNQLSQSTFWFMSSEVSPSTPSSAPVVYISIIG